MAGGKSGNAGADDDEERDPWGADLYLDDAERYSMARLPEIEREKILSERYDLRQKMADQRKARETGGAKRRAQPAKTAKSSALDDLRRRRKAQQEADDVDSGSDHNDDDDDDDADEMMNDASMVRVA
jgi:hypothetical protein